MVRRKTPPGAARLVAPVVEDSHLIEDPEAALDRIYENEQDSVRQIMEDDAQRQGRGEFYGYGRLPGRKR